MSHVKPFLIVGIDAFGDVGIAGWGQGEREESERLAAAHGSYPAAARLTVIYLEKEKDLRLLRQLQKEGAGRNDGGVVVEGWSE